MSPGDRLRKARLAAGYELAADAARAFGWVESTYNSHENGSRGFPKRKAETYAKAFKVSAQWLLFGSGDDEGSRILSIYKRLPADLQAQLFAHAETLDFAAEALRHRQEASPDPKRKGD